MNRYIEFIANIIAHLQYGVFIVEGEICGLTNNIGVWRHKIDIVNSDVITCFIGIKLLDDMTIHEDGIEGVVREIVGRILQGHLSMLVEHREEGLLVYIHSTAAWQAVVYHIRRRSQNEVTNGGNNDSVDTIVHWCEV